MMVINPSIFFLLLNMINAIVIPMRYDYTSLDSELKSMLATLKQKHIFVYPIKHVRPGNVLHPNNVEYSIDAYDHIFHIVLVKNTALFAPDYKHYQINSSGKVTEQTLNDANTNDSLAHYEHCYYNGHVKSIDGKVLDTDVFDRSLVAVSTCGGLHGVIKVDSYDLYIHPGARDEGHTKDQHIMFRSDDMQMENAACGHSHTHDGDSVKNQYDIASILKSPILKSSNIRSLKQSKPAKINYIELLLVNDKLRCQQKGSGVLSSTANIANIIDGLYQRAVFTPTLRVTLVAQVSFSDVDPYQPKMRSSEVDYDSLLSLFQRWAINPQNKVPVHDCRHLLSGYNFYQGVVGYAPMYAMCSTSSGGIEQSKGFTDQVVATTVAHEIGHNLGMEHTTGASTACPANNSIMSATMYDGLAPTTWAECSINEYEAWYASSRYNCMVNEPYNVYGLQTCGDGFVDGSEDCDCGDQPCSQVDPCCDQKTCKLLLGAKCSEKDECCHGCQLRLLDEQFNCRKALHGQCDTVRICSGLSAICPSPQYVKAGTTCDDGFNGKGMCYAGLCFSQLKKCRSFDGIVSPSTENLIPPFLPCPTQGSAEPYCKQLYCIDSGTDITTCHALPKPTDIHLNTFMDDGMPCSVGNAPSMQCLAGECISSLVLDSTTGGPGSQGPLPTPVPVTNPNSPPPIDPSWYGWTPDDTNTNNNNGGGLSVAGIDTSSDSLDNLGIIIVAICGGIVAILVFSWIVRRCRKDRSAMREGNAMTGVVVGRGVSPSPNSGNRYSNEEAENIAAVMEFENRNRQANLRMAPIANNYNVFGQGQAIVPTSNQPMQPPVQIRPKKAKKDKEKVARYRAEIKKNDEAEAVALVQSFEDEHNRLNLAKSVKSSPVSNVVGAVAASPAQISEAERKFEADVASALALSLQDDNNNMANLKLDDNDHELPPDYNNAVHDDVDVAFLTYGTEEFKNEGQSKRPHSLPTAPTYSPDGVATTRQKRITPRNKSKAAKE